MNKKFLPLILLIISMFWATPASFSNESSETIDLIPTSETPKKLDKNELKFQEIMDLSRGKNWSNLSMGELMQVISEQFLGASYQAGLLDKSNQETLVISLTQFDCVLFVETVLALARNIISQDYQYENFTKNISNQRYRQGEMTDYCSRLHYFSEWIADNQNRNNVVNITADLGGIKLNKKLNFMSQHRSSYSQLADDTIYQCIQGKEKDLENLDIYYLPTEEISKHYHQLQSGDIIGVATNISGLDVTHTGLVYRSAENVGLIHASPIGKVTIARDLQAYISKVDQAIGIIVARPINPKSQAN